MEKVMIQTDLYDLLNRFNLTFTPSLTEDGIDLKVYAEKLMNQALTYIALRNNETAGFISFFAGDSSKSNSFIVLLAVLPEYQGNKVAQELMDQCIKESIVRNKKGIKLEVQKDNTAALAFYEKNRFKVIEDTARHSVYMLRTIDHSDNK